MNVRPCLAALGFLVAAACGGDEDEASPSEVDCSDPVPTFAQVSAFTECAQCHSSSLSGTARRQAPAAINFDTHEGASAAARSAAVEVERGRMPPAGSGISLSAEQEQELLRWASCGTPE